MFTEAMLNLYTQDLPRAVGFYRDLIGFEQTYRFPADGAPRLVELRLGPSRLAISDHAALAETAPLVLTPQPGGCRPGFSAHGAKRITPLPIRRHGRAHHVAR
jgi:catechol 2,3-dioxygenase-like lactoylglutathione lyase family enzyme